MPNVLPPLRKGKVMFKPVSTWFFVLIVTFIACYMVKTDDGKDINGKVMSFLARVLFIILAIITIIVSALT